MAKSWMLTDDARHRTTCHKLEDTPLNLWFSLQHKQILLSVPVGFVVMSDVEYDLGGALCAGIFWLKYFWLMSKHRFS